MKINNIKQIERIIVTKREAYLKDKGIIKCLKEELEDDKYFWELINMQEFDDYYICFIAR